MSEITHRRIFIGDVHGHYDGLMVLLDAVAPGADDHVYFVGDLIDRGPQSADVVEFVRQSGYGCVLGNHEQLLLDSFPNGRHNKAALEAWLYSGGRATMASYGKAGIPMAHLEWMRRLPLYLDLGDIWLVHAGVEPNLPLEKQTPEQFCWIRDEFHRSTKPYFPDKLIITGHTITFTLPGVAAGELAQGQGWLDIDTGVYHPISGWLTGVDITEQKVYQVNVFQYSIRTLPLDEAIRQIQPERVLMK